MIAFGSAIVDPEAYRRYAGPGIQRAAEADSAVHAFAAVGHTPRGYNLLLDTAAEHDDLEALVLVHPRAEIAGPGFCAVVRDALRDPEVAVAGPAGARDVRTIAWWEGDVSCAPIVHHYHEYGGGEMAGYAWAGPGAPLGEVDSIDGFLMVLSPWAVRTIRFDESLVMGHGYDLDYCLQVRDAGRKVVTADMRVIHHHTLELLPDADVWVEGHIKLAEKWDGSWPGRAGEPVDWKRRARRAEAEREAARTMAYSNTLRVDAEVLALERAMTAMTESLSWRLTGPLRRLNRMRRRAP
jgi:hypothetical protein